MRDDLARLYSVFARYPRPTRIESCPCCTREGDVAALHSRPLTELTDDDLSLFAMKAITTMGSVDDLRHYLPRMIELASDGAACVDVQRIGQKLDVGEVTTWPADERAALEAWVRAQFDLVLDEGDARDIVLVAHALGLPLEPLVARTDLATQAATRAAVSELEPPWQGAVVVVDIPSDRVPLTVPVRPGAEIAIGRRVDSDIIVAGLAGSTLLVRTDADGLSEIHLVHGLFALRVNGERVVRSRALRDRDRIELDRPDGELALRMTYRLAA